ncbi:hypothetical protein [Halalkalicoccus subterraneus]|uniref:hypothetical protein n=1 Tax=Halalkalicoccus subterraneus TaxID=2675002 RepID=UPI0013CE3F01|nr:hypothetical protein [Halalkalicoccus subterraneus]
MDLTVLEVLRAGAVDFGLTVFDPARAGARLPSVERQSIGDDPQAGKRAECTDEKSDDRRIRGGRAEQRGEKRPRPAPPRVP